MVSVALTRVQQFRWDGVGLRVGISIFIVSRVFQEVEYNIPLLVNFERIFFHFPVVKDSVFSAIWSFVHWSHTCAYSVCTLGLKRLPLKFEVSICA